MTEEKTTKKRAMSPKWFLSLGAKSGIKSAEAFLSAHRQWLETGEMANDVRPILVAIDAKEVFPTPGLDAILLVALDHVIAADISKAEGSLNRSSEPRTEKPYVAVIRDANGEIATVLDDKKEPRELRAGFDHVQEADRWCQRRLNEGSTGQYGEVTWAKVLTSKGTPMVTTIGRNDAIKALTPVKKSPYMHRNKAGGGPLKPRMSVSQSRSSFSRG